MECGTVNNRQYRNTTRAACVIAAGMMVAAFGAIPAMAQDQKYDSISTAEQRRACRPDVYRLCAGEIPSVAKITACMRRNKANLSDACKAVFDQ